MSAECRKQLRRRQKVIAQDYKADYGLTKACRVPIRELHCKQLANMDLDKIGAIDPEHVERTKLSSILLCLEGKPIILEFDLSPPNIIILSTWILIFEFTPLWITDAAREKDDAISPACIAEMEAHRRQLMNDFQISPELVVKCAKDIQVCHTFVKTIIRFQGK